jgi:hypothetical protein
MLKGYTLPRTPRGTSSLAPTPPWHYVGNTLAVEFEANPVSAAAFLPEGLELLSERCAAYFIEWQYVSETGEEYLDPSPASTGRPSSCCRPVLKVCQLLTARSYGLIKMFPSCAD